MCVPPISALGKLPRHAPEVACTLIKITEWRPGVAELAILCCVRSVLLRHGNLGPAKLNVAPTIIPYDN